MKPEVHWLLNAQDRLEETLAAASCKVAESADRKGAGAPMVDGEHCLKTAYARLSQAFERKLADTFPNAEHIIVLDFLRGYSLNHGKFVLRVEVTERSDRAAEPRPHAFIVKNAQEIVARDLLAEPARKSGAVTPGTRRMEQNLGAELRGWETCQRRGNDRGRIFMRLRPGKPSAAGKGWYETLMYEDAHQVLRAAEVVSLEQAVLDACRWGRPPADSVDDVIAQIYYEMSDRFYKRSWSEEPRQYQQQGYWHKRLERGLRAWLNADTQVGKARRDAMAALSNAQMEFVEPCQYFKEIQNGVEWLPEMQRGCAHGDLHGRNVLVGMIDGQAKWPAVYDYEDMRCNNYLAWDFVKLEVELKARALAQIVTGSETEFVKEVYDFELDLARETEDRNNRQEWSREHDLQTGKTALRGILLGIRRMARKCLDLHRGRHRRWLDEYYFLLTCYGVYVGRFDTYQWRESLAAYVCTGVVAYRYAWRRGVCDKQVLTAEEYARAATAKDSKPIGFDAYCYHAKMAYAAIFARSRNLPFVKEAVKILTALRQEHYWIAEIGNELAFALMELAELEPKKKRQNKEAARKLLAELDDQFRGYDSELVSRIGRWWKERADAAADASQSQAADYYEQSLKAYKRAYDIDNHYYPGINAATLYWILNRQEEAAAAARELLQTLDRMDKTDPPDNPNEELWRDASRGEARLLLGQMQAAIKYYRKACAAPECSAQARNTMLKQVQRILKDHALDAAKTKALLAVFKESPSGAAAPKPKAKAAAQVKATTKGNTRKARGKR